MLYNTKIFSYIFYKDYGLFLVGKILFLGKLFFGKYIFLPRKVNSSLLLSFIVCSF